MILLQPTSKSSAMPLDRIVAMNVTDEAGYADYRAAMRPILAEYGGSFAHDFRVAETLASEAPHPVTRLFVIRFPDEASMHAFFADARYRAVRSAHYLDAVDGATQLGQVLY